MNKVRLLTAVVACLAGVLFLSCPDPNNGSGTGNNNNQTPPTVTSSADSGPGSLRHAIENATAGDTITIGREGSTFCGNIARTFSPPPLNQWRNCVTLLAPPQRVSLMVDFHGNARTWPVAPGSVR